MPMEGAWRFTNQVSRDNLIPQSGIQLILLSMVRQKIHFQICLLDILLYCKIKVLKFKFKVLCGLCLWGNFNQLIFYQNLFHFAISLHLSLYLQWKADNLSCKVLMMVRAFGYYLSSCLLVVISFDRYSVRYSPQLTISTCRMKLVKIFYILSLPWDPKPNTV